MLADDGCSGSNCSEQQVTENSSDDANKGVGFYWYDDPEQEEETPQPSYPSYQELWDMHPDDFAPLLEERKKIAIQYPTEDNVYRYLEIQDVAKRKSLAFAAVMGLVAQKHPEFSNENHYPLNVPGQRALTRVKNRDLDSYIESIQDQYALIVFEKEGCEFCQTQKPILDMFRVKYAWQVKFLDIEKYRYLADRYSITMTPSILVLSRETEEAMPLSSGVISLSKLRERLVRSVKYMKGEVKPEQFYTRQGTTDPLKFVNKRGEGGEDE